MPHFTSGYHRFDSYGRIVRTNDLNSPESRLVPKHLRQEGNSFIVAYLNYGMSYEPIAFAVVDRTSVKTGTFPCNLKPIPNAKSKNKVENFLKTLVDQSKKLD